MKKSFILALCATVFFSSCNKDENMVQEKQQKNEVNHECVFDYLVPKPGLDVPGLSLEGIDPDALAEETYTEQEFGKDFILTFNLRTFKGKCYFACKANAQNSKSTDVTRISFKSELGKKLTDNFHKAENGAKSKTFTTENEDEFNKWHSEKINEGYIVVSYYYEGSYYGTAYTPEEWAELNEIE